MESKPPKPESLAEDVKKAINDAPAEDVKQEVKKAIKDTPVETVGGKLTTGKSGSLDISSIKEQPWQEWIDSIAGFLATIPEKFGAFFSSYKQPLVTLLIILSAIVTVRIVIAVLGAIDDIPLLSPVLELVGLGYAAWFVYRYLWKAENRQELFQEFEAFKSQIVGRNSQDS